MQQEQVIGFNIKKCIENVNNSAFESTSTKTNRKKKQIQLNVLNYGKGIVKFEKGLCRFNNFFVFS